jgi:hypothetical protein
VKVSALFPERIPFLLCSCMIVLRGKLFEVHLL